MDVQWYPGQMAKAKRLLKENLKLVDAVIEVLDARIPLSSQNPDIRDILEKKPAIAALTRADLADREETKTWLSGLQEDYFSAAAVNANTGDGIKQLIAILKTVPKRRKHSAHPLRLMVVGIPNVGKSSLINRLIGRSAAATGDKPGITKGKQWVRLAGNLELLDTPGLLWPKIHSSHQAFCLAAVGAVKDEIFDPAELAMELILFFAAKAPQQLISRYNLQELSAEPKDTLYEIGRRRGCLIKGGDVDMEAAARILIKDFREARLGRITLETPGAQGELDDEFLQNDNRGDRPLSE